MDNNCIFCKIIKNEIPCYKIYEDEYTLAFLDISNDSFGHTLVIPKEHYRNLIDVPEIVLDKVIKTVKLISKYYVENCGFDGVDIVNANEPAGEQTIFHLHFHIIPRKENDEQKIFPNLIKNTESLAFIADKLKVITK